MSTQRATTRVAPTAEGTHRPSRRWLFVGVGVLAAIGVALALLRIDRRPLEERLHEIEGPFEGDEAIARQEELKRTLVREAPSRLDEYLRVIESGSAEDASAAASVLVYVDLRPIASELRALANSQRPRARFWAVRLLLQLAWLDENGVRVLEEGLSSGDSDIRVNALMGIGTIAPVDRIKATPSLLSALSRNLSNDAEGGLAARALTRFGRVSVSTLIEALKDPKADWWAIGALSDLGPQAKDAIPALEAFAATKTGDGQHQRKAIEAIEKIRGK